MFRNSIRQKIVGIAAGLIVLAVITSLLSMVMAGQVGHLLDELTNRYIPAYGHLARVNIRSLERSLAMRRMMMAKMQAPGEASGYDAARKTFDEIEPTIKREADAARVLIDSIIADPSTPSDNAALIIERATGEFIAADNDQAAEDFDGVNGTRSIGLKLREFLR